jgi:hypothetical protein
LYCCASAAEAARQAAAVAIQLIERCFMAAVPCSRSMLAERSSDHALVS